MTKYNVYIGASETIFYTGTFGIEADSEEEAIEKAQAEFFFDCSPYSLGSDGIEIQECFCE